VTDEEVQVILDQYEATNARDFERVMSCYADDVELIVREPYLTAGRFKGRDAVGAWFGDWFNTFDRDITFEVRECRKLPNGDVLLVAANRARGRASGVELEGTVVWVYRVADGKITRVEGYPTREAALEAAGAEE
jgi:ketosteroid isomerase-like protein